MKSTAFKVCFVIFVIGAIVLRYVDNPGPGIIAFELAHKLEVANDMVAQWEALDVIPLKKFSLFFDYIFIIGYAGSLFLVLQDWWRKSHKNWLKFMQYVPILAGVLDGIENIGLLQIVYHQGTQFSASLAFYCASIKFIILVPAVLLVLFRFYRLAKS